MKFVTVEGDTATIAVEGRYDLIKSLEVTPAVKQALAQNANVTHIHVDFTNTSYIDSSTERDLIRLRRQVGKDNFTASGATGMVLAALKTAKLDTWLS